MSDSELTRLYNDLLQPGARQLYLTAKKAGLTVSEKYVRDWVKGQEHSLEYASNGKDKPVNWFKITDVPNSFAVDAIIKGDYNKKQNEGARGFIMFIELTTRKIYAYPFTTGSENSAPVAQEAKGIFERFQAERKSEGHPVARISGDNGKEFDNNLVQNFLRGKYIETYFHRPEDHRANGTLNAAARFLRKRIGNNSIVWIDKLAPAVRVWNDHIIRTIKNSPDVLEDDKTKRDDIREDALAHNQKVWAKTSFVDNPIVKRYLRRNTQDKGLFDKEGKNFVGDFKVGERKGYGYLLSKPDGSILANAYRPYELRKANQNAFNDERQKYTEKQAQEEANKVAKTVARKSQRELGKAPEKRVVNEKREVKQPERINPSQKQQKIAKPPKLNESSIPIKILTHRGSGDALEFHIQWKDTPQFRKKWANDPRVDLATQTSWQPWYVLTDKNKTNAVVGDYIKSLKDRKVITAIKQQMDI